MTRPRIRGAALRACRAEHQPSPAAAANLPPSIEGMRWVHDYLASGAGSRADRELLLGYATGTLRALTHADHVRLGWLCLQHHDMVAGPTCFDAFRESQGTWITAIKRTHGYHETLTRAYLLLIEVRALEDELVGEKDRDSLAFVQTWPDLLDHSVLDEIFGAGAFAALKADERARREWVSPEEWRRQ